MEAMMRRSLILLVLTAAASVSAAPSSFAGPFTVTALATDATDAHLVNPWGLAASPTGPLWIGSNGSGKAEVYTGAGVRNNMVEVTIPGAGNVTGVTFNTGGFNGDTFLFVSEDGTISGWRNALGNMATAERFRVADLNNVYTGLTQAVVGGFSYAYVANFRTGTIDVLKGDSGAPDLVGRFTDPNVPAGYAPFNIQNLGGVLYVTYAVQDATGRDDVPGLGNGIVSRFDVNGNFLGRVVNPGGVLDSPWGLALAPDGFDGLAGDLLVGNFGNGLIHAFDPITGVLLDTLTDAANSPIVIDGLWALRAGNGGLGGDLDRVYFTAGPNDESGGEFGSIAGVGGTGGGPGGPGAVPEPATFALVGTGLAAAIRRRRN
jgi:uncharacterized protein (TIGR03118 family)